MIDDRHRVGEHVIEAGDRLLRKEPRPFPPFGLHADKDRLSLHFLKKVFDAAVVGHGKAEPAVDGDAIAETDPLGMGDRLAHSQAALEVDVEIDQGKAGLLQAGDLGVKFLRPRRRRRVGLRARDVAASIARSPKERTRCAGMTGPL